MPTSPIPSMAGKTAVVTGATSGIGRVVALRLAEAGATVWLVSRDIARCERTAAEIRAAHPGSRIETLAVDLSSLAGTRRAAGELLHRAPRLDVLVNNAGAVYAHREVTEEAIERTLALNVLAPFLLTELLRPALAAAAPSRVVMVSSAAHRRVRFAFDDPQRTQRYSGFRVYSESKLALILLTHEFARRLAADRIDVNAVHPGFVRTGFGRNNPGWFGRGIGLASWLFAIRPERGSRTPLYVATDPGLTGVTGKYFSHRRATSSSRESFDPKSERRMWDLADQWVRAAPGEVPVPGGPA